MPAEQTVRRLAFSSLCGVAAAGAALYVSGVPRLAFAQAVQSLTSPTYTAVQSAQGKAAFTQSCASCHGSNLDGGEAGGPLKGVEFLQRWGGKSAESLFAYMSAKMPPAGPGELGDRTFAQVLAYLLQENGVQPGSRDLPSDSEALKTMMLPSALPGAGGGLSAGIPLPPFRVKPSPLDTIRPVTDAMLTSAAGRRLAHVAAHLRRARASAR